jgi:hypothetical protein
MPYKHIFKFILPLFLVVSLPIYGQNITINSAQPNSQSQLELAELEIVDIINKLSEAIDISVKNELNAALVETLLDVMSLNGSMSYPFEKFYAISDLANESNSFRIFTWELENENGENTYHGVVNYSNENEVISLALRDSSATINNPEYQKNTNERWYGALYYAIKEVSYKKEQHIVLLGINRNKTLIKKKIIEVVNIDDELKFGKEVFDLPKGIGIKRKIYQYSNEADMSVWFESQEPLIVMDHLAPLNEVYKGKFEYYVPDLSFDAFEFKKGKWQYVEDYDARMEKNLKDRFYEMELPDQQKVY